jgi:uncharacterized membrane protein
MRQDRLEPAPPVPDIALFEDPEQGFTPEGYVPPPPVRSISPAEILVALRKGAADFRNSWWMGMTFAAVYVVGGLLLVGALFAQGYAFAAFPAIAGFLLIGPATAVAFYEISRRLEAGEPLAWGAIAGSFRRHGGTQLLLFGGVLIFLMLIWIRAATLLYALEFGANPVSPAELAANLASPDALGFLLTGNAVGAVLAAVTFTVSVVAVPLLLDRDIDFMTALATSVRACLINPVSMLFWAMLIGVMLALSIATGLLGLLVALPIVGHANWHVYRHVVAETSPDS